MTALEFQARHRAPSLRDPSLRDPSLPDPSLPTDVAPPRVLHVLEAVRGGTSRHVLDVVRSVPVEHHVAVPPPGVAAEGSGAPPDEAAVAAMAAAGATVHRVDMRRSPAAAVNLGALVELRRLARDLGVTVLHGHSAIGGALARLAAAGTSVPAVYTPNGLALSRTAMALERALGPLTAVMVAVSPSEAELAADRHLVSPTRISVIPNGVVRSLPPRPAPPWDDLHAAVGARPGAPLVGTVARLVDQKAPERFVAVCAAVARRHPTAEFVLVGGGPLQPTVDAAVAAAGLGDRWHQVTHLPGAAAVLGQLRCLVLASRFEGAPYTPLEAMRAGVPVVLSDVVGNRDAVVDGVSGVLRPFGDDEAMAEAVTAILDSPTLADRLRCGAAQRLAAEFDLEVIGLRLAGLYRSLSPALV